MLNSVQYYVQGLLNGATSPYLEPMDCLLAPPVDTDVTTPTCYLWAGKGKQIRQTAPRPVAYKKQTWEVEGALAVVMDFDDPNLNSAFPLLIDQLTATLNITPCPVVITDPDTGFQTQVLSIGELLDYNYARVMTTGAEGQGLVKFICELMITVEEKIEFMPGSYYNP